MTKILTCDENTFVNHFVKLEKKTIVIRIASNRQDLEPVSEAIMKSYDDSLVLFFSEITKPVVETYANGKTETFKPFDEHMRNRVMAFIERNIDAEDIIVHCAAGIARSTALAESLHLYYPHIEKPVHQNGKNIMPYPHVFNIFGYTPYPYKKNDTKSKEKKFF